MKFRYYIEYSLALFFRGLLMLMPRRAALWFGRRMGDLFYLVDARHRKEVIANLDLAYKDELAGAEKKKIARNVYRHFGSILFDFLRTPRMTKKKLEKIAVVEGWENLENALSRNKGVLVLAAHFGFWEMMGVAQGFYGHPLSVVARKLDNPFLEKMLFRYRTRSGNEVLYKQNAVKAIFKLLKEKKATAVLIDQNVGASHGIFVDFFGVKACTTPVISAIALKSGAPVVSAFSIPQPGGKWRLVYGKPLEFKINGDRKEAIYEVTQKCTDIIEGYIRQHPEAWLWMHRRWKTRPPKEKSDGK